ncbi:MAG: phosphotransacetylase family protein [Chloroflexi bacterium]|nr:phosphotransacetylase family protein [Chloroflexota bacterium]
MNELGTGEDSRKVAEALGAKVLIVEAYPKQISKAIDSYKIWGALLLGLVWNKVPKGQLEQVQKELSKQLSGAGINFLGVLPDDRILFTLTVGELAEQLKGKIINSSEKSNDVVENIMLGSMYVDSGLEYFGRKNNKAVIVKGERPDMQMAALETSTNCLVLTDNKKPIPAVLHKAEEKKVSLIQVKENLTATVTAVEGAPGKSRFNGEAKLSRLTEIMTQHFNFAAVYQGLGLAG